jgi:hypothetical protein
MPAATVTMVGVEAMRRDWARLWANGGPVDKAMAAAGVAAVAPIASLTRSAVPSSSGRLAATVRTRPLRTGGEVDMGDSGTRYAGWIEFGGWRRAPHESYRDYDSRGRFLFPSGLAALHDATVDTGYTKAIQGACDGFGWTNRDTAAADSIHD